MPGTAMLGWLTRWRRQRVLQRQPLDAVLWQQTLASLPLLDGLGTDEQRELEYLATLFLHDKSFEPVQGLLLTDADRYWIAAQACLPILGLGLEWYDDWRGIVIYPYDFVGGHAEIDDAGVIHEHDMLQTGESWQHGPVILSLPEVRNSGHCDGNNVVIHELAHKLDMLNGDANGYPPLHRNMSSETWSRVFQAAYDDLGERVDSHIRVRIDAYATESPAECFAVFSEYFFSLPGLLQAEYPQVYEQLVLFYRQQPLQRLPSSVHDSAGV